MREEYRMPARTLQEIQLSRSGSLAVGRPLQFHMQFSSGLLQAIKGMTLSAAKQYLQDVCDKKRHRRQSRSQADVSLS